MAYTNRIIVSRSNLPDEKHVEYDEQTDSYSSVISEGNREFWTDQEIKKAKKVSLLVDQPVTLIYVECFGGSCDHWAKIFKNGHEVKAFNEHSKLEDIMNSSNIKIQNDYYEPFSLVLRDK
jgi:hypothetical protein